MNEAGKKKLLVVIRKSPYGSTLARAALDTALAAAAFDQAVQLLFMGEGVLQLLPDQDSRTIDKKSIGKLIDSLPLYDIESVFVDASALQRFAIAAEELPQSLELMDDAAARDLLSQHHHLLSF
jgi:tRNA 2-thiouridine synthesizing protein C